MSERRSKWDAPAAVSPPGASAASGAAAAAAAAAAKIAAQYGAAPSSNNAGQLTTLGGGGGAKREDHDAEFTHDIEINDHKNRYVLTKGQTQQQLLRDTGASVTTKGTWYPQREMATEADPPLYLHIAATTQEILDKGIKAVQELIAQEPPSLENPTRMPERSNMPERRVWNDAKVPIGLETLRNFNVRAKVVGPGGLFVKYIQGETGTRVQIKGQGSGFVDTHTQRESEEPMHIHITGPDDNAVQEGRKLAEDLLDAVRTEYAKAHAVLVAQGVWAPPLPAGIAGSQQQTWNAPGAGPNGLPQQPGGAMPPQPNEQPPPPPPEDAAPPPPADPTPATPAAPAPSAAAASKPKTPEEIALEKYWKDYKTWEDSFRAYHSRMPNKDEGLQDMPDEYRR